MNEFRLFLQTKFITYLKSLQNDFSFLVSQWKSFITTLTASSCIFIFLSLWTPLSFQILKVWCFPLTLFEQMLHFDSDGHFVERCDGFKQLKQIQFSFRNSNLTSIDKSTNYSITQMMLFLALHSICLLTRDKHTFCGLCWTRMWLLLLSFHVHRSLNWFQRSAFFAEMGTSRGFFYNDLTHICC
jgi:hypothetical protein